MKQLDKDWEGLATTDLEAMLQEELRRDEPDEEAVLSVLHILEKREEKLPVELSGREQEALDRYRQKRKMAHGILPARGWLAVAASLILVVTILFSAIPQNVNAESFWGMLQRIGDAVVEYLSLDEWYAKAEDDYVFVTDHPGLQEVYDTVAGLGITEPVVPMWIPKGYHLDVLNVTDGPMTAGVSASFYDEQSKLVFQLSLYAGEPAHQFYRDDTHYETWELNGTDYHVTKNHEWWIVVWEKENIECFLALDCQEEDFWRILDSIYVTED